MQIIAKRTGITVLMGFWTLLVVGCLGGAPGDLRPGDIESTGNGAKSGAGNSGGDGGSGGAGGAGGGATPTDEVCDDGIDNNDDDFVDCNDASCATSPLCCTPSGPEICDDGLDNDCDGRRDCPVFLNVYPAGQVVPTPTFVPTTPTGGAVAPEDVEISLDSPVATGATLQCRSGHIDAIVRTPYGACSPGLQTVLLSVNGLYRFDARYQYENGAVSEARHFFFYVHDSLAGETRCPVHHTDEEYFTKALERLTTSKTIDTYALANPFIRLEFKPNLISRFHISSSPVEVDALSLRRRFTLNDDRTLLLMKRTYIARSNPTEPNGGCTTTTILVHTKYYAGLGWWEPAGDLDPYKFRRFPCDALVFNAEGDGVCLNDNPGGAPIINRPLGTTRNSYTPVLWRRIFIGVGAGNNESFSPKCYSPDESCATGHRLYLPDADAFGLR